MEHVEPVDENLAARRSGTGCGGAGCSGAGRADDRIASGEFRVDHHFEFFRAASVHPVSE